MTFGYYPITRKLYASAQPFNQHVHACITLFHDIMGNRNVLTQAKESCKSHVSMKIRILVCDMIANWTTLHQRQNDVKEYHTVFNIGQTPYCKASCKRP